MLNVATTSKVNDCVDAATKVRYVMGKVSVHEFGIPLTECLSEGYCFQPLFMQLLGVTAKQH
jgi:hypothetical protein